MIFEELMIDADGFCAAAHAVVQLCLEVQPGYRPVLWLLLYCCEGFLKLLEAEQAVRLQSIMSAPITPAMCRAIHAKTCRRLSTLASAT